MQSQKEQMHKEHHLHHLEEQLSHSREELDKLMDIRKEMFLKESKSSENWKIFSNDEQILVQTREEPGFINLRVEFNVEKNNIVHIVNSFQSPQFQLRTFSKLLKAHVIEQIDKNYQIEYFEILAKGIHNQILETAYVSNVYQVEDQTLMLCASCDYENPCSQDKDRKQLITEYEGILMKATGSFKYTTIQCVYCVKMRNIDSQTNNAEQIWASDCQDTFQSIKYNLQHHEYAYNKQKLKQFIQQKYDDFQLKSQNDLSWKTYIEQDDIKVQLRTNAAQLIEIRAEFQLKNQNVQQIITQLQQPGFIASTNQDIIFCQLLRHVDTDSSLLHLKMYQPKICDTPCDSVLYQKEFCCEKYMSLISSSVELEEVPSQKNVTRMKIHQRSFKFTPIHEDDGFNKNTTLNVVCYFTYDSKENQNEELNELRAKQFFQFCINFKKSEILHSIEISRDKLDSFMEKQKQKFLQEVSTKNFVTQSDYDDIKMQIQKDAQDVWLRAEFQIQHTSIEKIVNKFSKPKFMGQINENLKSYKILNQIDKNYQLIYSKLFNLNMNKDELEIIFCSKTIEHEGSLILLMSSIEQEGLPHQQGVQRVDIDYLGIQMTPHKQNFEAKTTIDCVFSVKFNHMQNQPAEINEYMAESYRNIISLARAHFHK